MLIHLGIGCCCVHRMLAQDLGWADEDYSFTWMGYTDMMQDAMAATDVGQQVRMRCPGQVMPNGIDIWQPIPCLDV